MYDDLEFTLWKESAIGEKFFNKLRELKEEKEYELLNTPIVYDPKILVGWFANKKGQINALEEVLTLEVENIDESIRGKPI